MKKKMRKRRTESATDALLKLPHLSPERRKLSTLRMELWMQNYYINDDVEFYAITLTGGMVLRIFSVAMSLRKRDWIEGDCPTVYRDSSAARGICRRTGVGKLKHMQIRWHRVQENVRNGIFGHQRNQKC